MICHLSFESRYHIVCLVHTEFACLGQVRQTFLVLAGEDVRQTTVEIGFREVVVNTDGLRIIVDGIFILVLRAEDIGFVVQRKGEVWLQSPHLVIAGNASWHGRK